MKRIYFILMAMAVAMGVVNAKEIKELRLTTEPPMHCESCETKIKEALKFEKGVKDIATNVTDQCVTITYDADKGDEANYLAALKKVGYDARPYGACEGEEPVCGKKKDGGECSKAGSCCKKVAEGQCTKAEGQCSKTKGECAKGGETHCTQEQTK